MAASTVGSLTPKSCSASTADRRWCSKRGCWRSAPAPLDLLLFCADKLAWDQPGRPPYLADMRAALDDSLAAAAAVYLLHLWRQRDTLPAVHPLLVEAWEYFEIEE
jgi:HD superfamily phosphohydrolase YqeK